MSLWLLIALGILPVAAQEFCRESMPFSAVRPAWMRKETAKAEFAATGEDFRGQKSVRIGMMLQEENSPVAERRIWSYFPAAVSGRENASMKNRITPESIGFHGLKSIPPGYRNISRSSPNADANPWRRSRAST